MVRFSSLSAIWLLILVSLNLADAQDQSGTQPDRKIQLRFPVAEERTLKIGRASCRERVSSPV